METTKVVAGGRNAKKENNNSFSNNQISQPKADELIAQKRSNVMKNTNIFRAALSAIIILVLVCFSAMGQGNVTNTGSWTNTGILKAKDYTNSGSSAAFTNNGGSAELWIRGVLTTNAGGTPADPEAFDVTAGLVKYYKSSTQTVNHLVKSNTYNNLNLTGSADAKTLSGAITLTGVATADAAAFNISSYKVTASTVQAPFASANSGTFSFGSGHVEYGRPNIQDVYNTTYGTLTVNGSGTKSMAGTVTVSTALNLTAGTISIGDGFKLISNGSISDNTGAGTITGSATSDLTIGGTGALTLPAIVGVNLRAFEYARGDGNTIETQSSITVNGDLTAASGTLDVKSNTLTLMSTVAGTTGGFASSNDGTVIYGKTTDVQAVFATQYGNLEFSNKAKTLPESEVLIAGTFTAPASVTAHTVTNNTITFNNASDGQLIPAFNGAIGYNQLETASGDKTVNGNLVVGGDFTNGSDVVTNVSTYTLAITGTPSQSSNASKMQFANTNNGVVFASGIVEYNASTLAQTVTNGEYYQLLLTDGGATYKKTISAASSTTDLLTISGSAYLVVDAGVSAGTAMVGDVTSLNNAGTLEVKTTRTLSVTANIDNTGAVINDGTITVGE